MVFMLKFSNKKTGVPALVVIFVIVFAVFAVFASSVQAAPIVSVTATPLKALEPCPFHPDIMGVRTGYDPYVNSWRYDVVITLNNITVDKLDKMTVGYYDTVPTADECAKLDPGCYISPNSITLNSSFNEIYFDAVDNKVSFSYTTFNWFVDGEIGHSKHWVDIMLYYYDPSSQIQIEQGHAYGYDIVPEPLTAALLAGGMGLLIKRRRNF